MLQARPHSRTLRRLIALRCPTRAPGAATLGSTAPVANDNQGLRAATMQSVQTAQAMPRRPMMALRRLSWPAPAPTPLPRPVSASSLQPQHCAAFATLTRQHRSRAVCAETAGLCRVEWTFSQLDGLASGADAQDTLLAGYGSHGLNTQPSANKNSSAVLGRVNDAWPLL